MAITIVPWHCERCKTEIINPAIIVLSSNENRSERLCKCTFVRGAGFMVIASGAKQSHLLFFTMPQIQRYVSQGICKCVIART